MYRVLLERMTSDVATGGGRARRVGSGHDGTVTSEGDSFAARYVVTRPLGRGGMAEVWEARDVVLRRRVALKLFSATGDTDDARRAATEMHTLAGLSHPNLVTVYDAGREGDRTFLVMELVTGSTLADRMTPTGMDAATVATVGAQVAAGLAYIHGRGIVHRDVKPANVLLPVRDHVDAPVAKLADFGIAQHAGQDRLTQTGMTIGTAQYLAPEQVTGKPVGPPADVYALGLVLLEALGHGPAWVGSAVEIAVARLTRPPEVPDGLPPAWARLLTAMTAADPLARPSAADARAALATLVDDPGAAAGRTAVLPATEPSPPPTALLPAPRTASTWRGRRGALAGGLALLVGAGAVLIAVVATSGSSGGSAPTAPTVAVSTSTSTSPPSSAAPTTPGTTAPVAATSSAPVTPTTPTPTPPAATDAPPGPNGPAGPDRTPPGQTKSKAKGKPGG